MDYVELHARSAYSFLRGASSPEQLARQAASLGLPALALRDRDGVYGAPRLFAAAKEHGIRALVGAELTMEDDTVLPVLVESRTGYQNLCRLITQAKLRGTKTEHAVRYDELPEFAEGLVCLTGDAEGPLFKALLFDDHDGGCEVLRRLRGIFGDRHLFVEVQRHLWRAEDRVLAASAALARGFGLPLLATNGVLYAEPEGAQVLDVMTCTRFHTDLDTAGQLLSLNSARHLKSAAQMRRLFAALPEAVTNTVRLAERLEFSLENLGYEFPRYRTPEGENMDECLHRVTLEGARRRYGAKLAITLEADNSVRLGLCVVNGLNRSRGQELVQARRDRPYRSLQDLLARIPLDQDERRTLAALGAFHVFGGHRRDALWQVESAVPSQPDLFAQDESLSMASPLKAMDACERLQADFDSQNLTTGPHAMALVRPHLPPQVRQAVDLVHVEDGQRVFIAGNVICRQRPGTAKGFVFVSLEDETSIANVIVRPDLFETMRLTISQEAFLLIEGRVQVAEGTVHVKAMRLEGLRHQGTAHASSHDFH